MLSKKESKHQLVSSFYLNRWRYLETFFGTAGEQGWFEGPPVTLEELDYELNEQIFSELLAALESSEDTELRNQIHADMDSTVGIITGLRPHSAPPSTKEVTRLRSEGMKLRNRFVDKIQEYAKYSED